MAKKNVDMADRRSAAKAAATVFNEVVQELSGYGLPQDLKFEDLSGRGKRRIVRALQRDLDVPEKDRVKQDDNLEEDLED
jgi:hypothetical protein